MFKLEFIKLLNEYESCENKELQEKTLNSIIKVIEQNKEEYKEFIVSQELNPKYQNLIDDINLKLQNNQDENQNNQDDSDSTKIKKAFEMWNQEFQKNNQINDSCIKIVKQLISYYEPNKFEVITKILEITMDKNYEIFKTHIKNNLRALYAEKIEQYINTNKYEELGFFKKLKKKREIEKITKDLINYNFNKNKIQEVLN